VDEELAFHFGALVAELEAEGMAPGEAMDEALRRFGDVEGTRRALARLTMRRREREGRTMSFDGWMQDVRYAVRALRKSPGYALIVVLTLALGIGANTAVFSVMNPYFFRPLPYAESDQLVQVGHVDRASGFTWARFSLPQVEDYRARSRSTAAVGSYYYGSFNVTGAEGPERVTAGVLSDNMFQVLGTPAHIGRTFSQGEGGPSGSDVVVLDHGLWQRRYAGDPTILGRSIDLDGRPFEVIGVMPPDFVFPFGTVRLWVPDRRAVATAPRDVQGNLMVARLLPGISSEAIARDFSRIHAELAVEHPEVDGTWAGVHAAGLREALNFAWDILRVGLFAFLAAVGAVLLIACVNVTSLTLSRGQSRIRELALRNALGAARGRLVRQLVMESMVLAVVGGTLGLGLAWCATRALTGVLPSDLYHVGSPEPDARVLTFTLVVTLLTPIVFGLWPARATTRNDLTTPLREGGGGASQARRILRLRRGLVVAQVALGVVLVSATGLLVRSAIELGRTDLGFDASTMLTAEAIPSADAYPERGDHVAYWLDVTDAARGIPGVRHAATVYPLPLNHEIPSAGYAVPEALPPGGTEWPTVPILWSSPGYLDAAGITLTAGRDFLPGEGEDAEAIQPAIVSARVASSLWPGGEALGRSLVLRISGEPTEVRVVGVIEDHYHEGIGPTRDALVYLAMERRALRRRFLVVRGDGEPAALIPGLRDVMADRDPNLPVDLRAMSSVVKETAFPWTVGSMVLAVFGAVALLLAALGVYGVVSHTVSQRTREMAVRMSLGADAARVGRSVVAESLKLTLLGIGIGFFGALAVGRVVASLLFNVAPADPVALGVSVLVFVAVAVLAAFLPARRAAAVAPAVALRAD
jgi:putative ABC transport system permease protein